MKMKVTVIAADPAVANKEEIVNGDHVPLETLQKIVGGYIEYIPHFDHFVGVHCHAYANEEGRIHGLPRNERATELWKDQLEGPLRYEPLLFGDVAIVTRV